MAPLTAHVLAEIFHEAGVPAGVYNLVDADGPTVGAAIAGHPGIAMVSFTGSSSLLPKVDTGRRPFLSTMLIESKKGMPEVPTGRLTAP